MVGGAGVSGQVGANGSDGPSFDLPASARTGPVAVGPGLALLRRTLADASPDLFDDRVNLAALAADLAIDLHGAPVPADWLDHLDRLIGPGAPADRRAVVALSRELARLPEVVAALTRAGTDPAPWWLRALTRLIEELDGLRTAADWRSQEGAEELARAFLAVAGLLPEGESAEVAADVWVSVSTRNQREMAQAVALERARAEELARALEAKRAREAAAQYVGY